MRMGFPKSGQFVELFEPLKGIPYDSDGRQGSSVLVSFARHGRSKPQSFPSRHGGTGMTGVSKGIPPQMTPTVGGSRRFVYQAETLYNKRNQLGCWRRYETRTVTVEANGSGIRIRPVFLSAGGGATSSNCPRAHHATCGHGEARHPAREHPPAGAPRI